MHEGWNLKYCQYLVAPNVKDSYDVTQFGNNIERHYETVQSGNGGSNARFSWWPVNEDSEVDYCMHVMTSKNLFGCISMRGKEYCILNKQYSKEEHESLREKIIEQMKSMPYVDRMGVKYSYGEFFPSELSPFCYNETTAKEYFPLSKDDALKLGFAWFDREERNYKPTVVSESIPDDSSEIPEPAISEIFECANSKSGIDDCTTAFRVITDEVNFYKRFGIPLPDKCPNCRHNERMELRNIPKFRMASCAYSGCGKEILTAYPLGTPNLNCKEHYLQEVV